MCVFWKCKNGSPIAIVIDSGYRTGDVCSTGVSTVVKARLIECTLQLGIDNGRWSGEPSTFVNIIPSRDRGLEKFGSVTLPMHECLNWTATIENSRGKFCDSGFEIMMTICGIAGFLREGEKRKYIVYDFPTECSGIPINREGTHERKKGILPIR